MIRPSHVRPARAACLLLAAVLCLAAGGCAAFARRPDTPAIDLDERVLAKVPAAPDTRYYLLVFGSEATPKQPKYTHTWATVMKVTGPPGAEAAVECHTISWLPQTMDIRPERLTVEPGENFSLHVTLKHVFRDEQHVAMWGPYEVWHGFYDRFVVQKKFLDSGKVGYQCVDVVGEAAIKGNGSDCIHALTDMDPQYGRARYPLVLYGEAASANVVRRLMHSPIVIDPPKTHDWLIPRLDLDKYTITRRKYSGRASPYKPGEEGGLTVVNPLDPILP